MQFEVSEHQEAGVEFVHVDGELDLLTAPKLSAELDTVIRHRDGDVVIDLRDAVFIDSAGLHILLNAHRRLIKASRHMSVLCREGPVRRVIELARLVETLGVASDLNAPPEPHRPPATRIRARARRRRRSKLPR